MRLSFKCLILCVRPGQKPAVLSVYDHFAIKPKPGVTFIIIIHLSCWNTDAYNEPKTHVDPYRPAKVEN